jgi:UDP-galactopyranose mutase
MKYDVCIIGCGITGITLANQFADRPKKRVLVLEKRDYIGGQCYDFRNEHGILVNKHGAHILHTRDERVWKHLNRFTEFNDYVHHVQTVYDGRYYDWPITLDTVNAVFGRQLDAEGAQALISKEAHDDGGDNFESAMIRQVGRTLYEMFIKNYTEKMWRRAACELSSELAFRVPLRLNNDKRLFDDPFQGIPRHGYTKMLEAMLDHPQIELQLNRNYRPEQTRLECDLLIVTAPIDEFYEYRFGRLEYRGMSFEWKTYDQESFQPVGTINTPQDAKLVRHEEPKKYYQQSGPKTSIAYNYPSTEGAYYPVMTPVNRDMAAQYLALGDAEPRTVFAGRLGRYMYINMDQAVAQALDLFDRLAAL